MQFNRYRIPLLQIRRSNGTLDFSKTSAQMGEYFINEIEFNNTGTRPPERGAGELGEKVSSIGHYGALTEMSAKTFNRLTPLINENFANHSNGPLRTPFLHVRIGDDVKVPVVVSSGGRTDVRRFTKLTGDESATLPVAVFVEKDGVLLTADEISQGMLAQIAKGVFAQNHNGDDRYLVRGPLFRQAVVSVMGYSFEAEPALPHAPVARRTEFGLQARPLFA